MSALYLTSWKRLLVTRGNNIVILCYLFRRKVSHKSRKQYKAVKDVNVSCLYATKNLTNVK